MKWVKVVSVPLPDEIAWFSLASVDPPLVNCMLMRFLAQWWQDGDTGAVTNRQVMVLPTGHPGNIPSITHLPNNDDPLTSQNHIQPGDFVCITSGPHKGLCSMLHWYSGHEILITPSMLQQADPDNLRDKGKSKAQEPEVPGGDGNIDEGSDLIQFCLMMVHCFCIKLENHSLHDIEHQVGHKVWIISDPKKGYRGMLQSVSRTYCNVAIKSGIMQLKNTAVVTEFGMCLNGAILDST
ncbi:hypothetical protein EDC04DRAFT_2603324 [Pisolithus marmoratus]|nr:hypothetical protein EDC04DRAFT_2603324 [Pisolithus marmoratus]